jgi:hypothetical protein
LSTVSNKLKGPAAAIEWSKLEVQIREEVQGTLHPRTQQARRNHASLLECLDNKSALQDCTPVGYEAISGGDAKVARRGAHQGAASHVDERANAGGSWAAKPELSTTAGGSFAPKLNLSATSMQIDQAGIEEDLASKIGATGHAFPQILPVEGTHDVSRARKLKRTNSEMSSASKYWPQESVQRQKTAMGGFGEDYFFVDKFRCIGHEAQDEVNGIDLPIQDTKSAADRGAVGRRVETFGGGGGVGGGGEGRALFGIKNGDRQKVESPASSAEAAQSFPARDACSGSPDSRSSFAVVKPQPARRLEPGEGGREVYLQSRLLPVRTRPALPASDPAALADTYSADPFSVDDLE